MVSILAASYCYSLDFGRLKSKVEKFAYFFESEKQVTFFGALYGTTRSSWIFGQSTVSILNRESYLRKKRTNWRKKLKKKDKNMVKVEKQRKKSSEKSPIKKSPKKSPKKTTSPVKVSFLTYQF